MDNVEFPSVLSVLEVFNNPVEIMVKLCCVSLTRFVHFLNNRISRHVLTPLRVLQACRKQAAHTQRHG